MLVNSCVRNLRARVKFKSFPLPNKIRNRAIYHENYITGCAIVTIMALITINYVFSLLLVGAK